jgi:DNA helicase II / ATP-dependent DNA helicase PcrA
MINFKEELNEEQLKVVYEGDGHCLVLSGPGSGKTRTLVYRAAFLLDKGVPASRVLLLTFTKKAASEMLSRIFNISKGAEGEICGGTFHHVANLLLRKYAKEVGYNSNFTILDEEDSKGIIKAVLAENKEWQRKLPKPQVIRKIISLSNNSLKSIDKIIEEYFFYLEESLTEEIKKVDKLYKKRKQDNGLMDFDDLLSYWNQLLTEKKISDKIAERFLYVLVDEYQDTNALQNEIIKKITRKHKNILAVGDDAQSIYSFRAADIANIINFKENFKKTKIFKLEKNYRSAPRILDIANNVIEHNTKRLEKKLKGTKKSSASPTVISFTNNNEQARFIADYILNNNNESIAILFRAHFHSVELEIELAKRKIPYILRGGVRFFEQHHIKDVLAYLRITLNFKDEASWRRLLLKQEGVGDVTAQKIIAVLLNRGDIKKVTKEGSSARSGAQVILSMLKKGEEEDIAGKINIFMEDFYSNYLDLSFENARERKNDIKRVQELSLKYKNLEDMLSEFSLSEDFQIEEGSKRKVVLSTVHQAKGLEWQTVFIISLKEGVFPHTKSLEDDLLEEERRLFYVAVTRCKENLFLTYPFFDFREKGKSIPSRFLKEAGLLKKTEEDVVYLEEEDDDDGEWETF